MKIKLRKFLIIFIAGLMGVASLLCSEIPIPDEIKAELLIHVSEDFIMLLLLINPTVLLLLSTLIGVSLQAKTTLKTPLVDKIINQENAPLNWSIVIFGVAGGLVAGLLIVFFNYLLSPLIPDAIKSLQDNLNLSVFTRFLYGGITEEILLRYGLMTLLVWVLIRFIKSDLSYWIAILTSSLLFGIGHLPAVYAAVDSVDVFLLAYIIIGNTLGGIVFGWLYWKKGLESAMIAHIFTHVVMLILL